MSETRAQGDDARPRPRAPVHGTPTRGNRIVRDLRATTSTAGWRVAAIALAAFVAPPAAAQEFRLALPLDCTLGETCDIQQYVDADPGPGARDYTGGFQAYDGHQGTDFRVPDLEAMAAGVPILAPAPGTVAGIRNTVPDGTFPEGQDCGNGLRIDHGGGWSTQLCHFAQGSVTVTPGDRVQTGDVLGRMGMTGRTQFPHVHITVRRGDTVVDPFVEGLWSDPPDYAPGGLLSAGFSDAIPEFDAIRAGTADAAELPVTAPALVLWGQVFGGQAGDVVRLSITGPGGRDVFATEQVLERTQALLFRAGGRRLREARWRGGDYVGRVELDRNGTVIDAIETRIALR
ncbi:M23 family metallopeptidase [Jannaschia sp. KMU-145]|uniref:M23 family metallopeptidase n=1 Tax=Jannaschia halovivens TaxID=3388667 RepID=UPI00396AF833